jgi:hypothetical protein
MAMRMIHRATAVASCACCELGPSVWPVGLGSGVAGRWDVGLAEHLLVLARVLPELPGGAPEGHVGWTPAWVGRPLVGPPLPPIQCADRSSVRPIANHSQ